MKKTNYYSLDEVKKHNSEGDYWVVINDEVYDLSRWAPHHPGGELPIRYMAGHDCTDVFKAFHLNWVSEKKLPAFKIGEVAEECKRSESSLVKDYRKVREEIERGLDTNYWFYVGHGIHLSVIFAVLVYGVVYSNNVYIQVASSITMALFWQQIAFVGHDLGHTAVTHNLKMDGLIGIFVGNMATGMSVGWWKRSHNAHHIVTNSVEFDPDIQHLPVIAITDKFFKSVRSMYHEKILYFDGLAKFFVSNQHWLYYLIMGLARYNLYAQSVLFVFSGTFPKGQNKYLEIFGMVFFWTWYIYLCSFLPSWTSLFIFVFVAHFLAGILHIQITLSHFSMETYHGHPMDAFNKSSSEFLRSQLATTMDIDCYPWLDFFHGGLQFQIEHHLFPRLPRHRLRAAKAKIIELCKKHNITYRTKTFLEANIEIVQQLKETAARAQCISPIIWEGINAIG
ncbi:hypothetical protein OS493_035799 [Desmophyllum pertusum]|uniref:Cytochrome b5 heme-binding domain-containing protein n=1 Tax=Desmophyllum pertusum TaxID=174260 RepID=A0A9W9YLF5_9CNID|nr:hypothetical protein OS493_035799 [Desmophyllum pertusum]